MTRDQTSKKKADADAAALKRGTNGSAFTRCENCNKDIPVAIADMHDCVKEAVTETRLRDNNVKATAAKEAVKNTQNADKGSSKKRERAATTKTSKKKSKQAKDPNMPKRPSTGFFLFMEDFRKSCKIDNPSAKSGPQVAKLGGEKWKEMTDEDKLPYINKAAELKKEYEIALKEYKNKSEEDGEASAEAEQEEEAEE